MRWSLPGPRARREILVAMALLFAYGFFQQVPAWNEYSRYDLVRAIVEEGTTRIDSFHENTGDKAFFDGHYYSDKAPGTAILGVPAFALLILTGQAVGLDTPNPAAAVAALSFVVSGVSTVVLVLLLVRFLALLVGEPWALVVGIGYGLGSIALPLATMFFGHAASAAALFGAFYVLHRWKRLGERWTPVLAGVLAGAAVVIEIPTVLGVAVLGCYALWLGRGVAFRFVLGGVPPALVLLGYDWLAFGNALSVGYQYATVFGDQNRQGFLSILWPSLSTAIDLMLSPRGLLSFAPWFAFAPFGLLAARDRVLRAEVVVCAVICGAFLTYNSGAINPFGGWTPGPRYLLPALPFAAVLVALVPARLRPVVALLIAISIVILLVATVTMPNAPELYRDPLVELWLPRLRDGHLADTIAWLRWGLHGLEPLVVLLFGLTVATAGLVASFRPRPVAARATIGTGALLLVLIVAFSLPYPPTSVRFVSSAQSATPSISVVDLGAERIAAPSGGVLSMWAQLENVGPAIADTRVEFSVLAPDGGRAWSGWYSGVDWAAGERRTASIDWDLRLATPGDYRVAIRVLSDATQATYASAIDPEVVHVDR